tara:strand:+ start:133 stop:633 length:501 start_codon:yes stop_codon:yes gene_type:complete
MKYSVEIILLVVLISLMYYRVNLLTVMASSNLGKLVLVGFVVMLHLVCGTNCSILAALIVIVVLHNKIEGFQEGSDGEEDGETGKNEGDEEKEDDDSSKTEPTPEEVADAAKEKSEEGNGEDEEDVDNLEVKETFISMSDLDRLFKTDSIKNTLDSTGEKIKSFMG